jgi:membrane protease YdiL (CAAX protease family)
MSTEVLRAAAECVAAVALWTAVFRLPFQDPRRRARLALWLGSRANADPQRAFAVFATLAYLGLAAGVLAWLALRYRIDLVALLAVRAPGETAALAVLGVAGSVAVIGQGVGIAYRLRPGLDVPGAVRTLQWLAGSAALPGPARIAVPVAGACAEELVFRGAVFGALDAAGGAPLVALAGSAALFAAQQAALTSTRVQAAVLVGSALVIGAMGGLLLLATGSLLPALVVHVSFAAFYSRPAR